MCAPGLTNHLHFGRYPVGYERTFVGQSASSILVSPTCVYRRYYSSPPASELFSSHMEQGSNGKGSVTSGSVDKHSPNHKTSETVLVDKNLLPKGRQYKGCVVRQLPSACARQMCPQICVRERKFGCEMSALSAAANQMRRIYQLPLSIRAYEAASGSISWERQIVRAE